MDAASLEKVTDLGTSPQAVARRWKLELKLASKREESWRKKARDICKLYTPENPMASSYNILWTNTETLRQACYNSLPQPKVRRRYNDEDELGKAVSDVLTRALEFCQDAYDFDAVMKGDVLAMLLPGRAVSRVRYIPSLREVGVTADTHLEENEEPTHEAQEGAYEEIDWEQVTVERVQWDDFRIGAARCWDDVPWVAFRHHLNREDLIEKFGDAVGNAVPLDSVADEDVKAQADMEMLFKTAEVWEIWDKGEQQVVWIATGYPKPVKVQEDPLKLQGFWPCPRPLYAIEQHDTLVPAALFSQYEQQAKELNKVSRRINAIVEALRVRGIYDATLTELGELMKAGDNELVPAANVTALLERGGLEKAIWMLPMETAAMVLKELYAQREATKQVIYEITGIADIMRASSDPAETFGAQKIKTQWGTQRLQRLQREVQRYIRDIVRLKAEIISEKFQPETLEQMTLVKLPHDADVKAQLQQQLQQWQQAAMQAAQQGQQPPPPPQPPDVVTWETAIDTMRSDSARTYHIDIETDSTLSASQDEDVTGISQLMQGVTQLMQGLAPIVQAGVMPIDAVKDIALAAVRRAKMGSAVEDALTKMQAPPPPSQDNTEAQKLQMQAQQHAAELQATAQLEQMKAQLQVEAERGKQQAQAEQSAQENQMQAQRELQKQQLQAEVEARKLELQQTNDLQRMEFEKWKAELEASTRILVAQLGAQQMVAPEVEAAAADNVVDALGNPLLDMHRETLAGIQQLVAAMARPKTIVRGADGRAVGLA